MTDTPPKTPPETRLKVTEIDRAQVLRWMERAYSSADGSWREIPSPEARRSNQYRVIAQLVGGEWVTVYWGRGVGNSGNPNARGQIGNRGGGRVTGSKNSKPRKDKGLPRSDKKSSV